MKRLALIVAALSLTSLTPAVKAAGLYLTNASNQLLRIDSATPGTVAATLAISGLQGGENILGIDFRPANGQLYGLGSNGRLYTINTATGAATFVSTLSVGLSGASFGVDFNPVADRLRITSNTGQNLRTIVDTGAVTVDTGLAYAAGDVNFGQAPAVTGSAYTNSLAGALTTTLYGIDTARAVLVTQNPPNSGTLNTIGSLGVTPGSAVGFDIVPLSGQAFAALGGAVGGFSNLYSLNLSTGAATLIGAIGAGQNVTGLAAISDVPEPASLALVMGGLGLLLYRRRR